MDARTLFETPSLIAVDKPAGVVVVPARGEDPAASLWRVLEGRRGERLWVVHRIDRDTSGVILFARDAGAHRALSLAWAGGAVRKTYLALVRGGLPAGQGEVDVALHAARKGRMRPAAPGEAGALPSRTAWRVVRRWDIPGGSVALVEARPFTGRHHQIRVHMRFLGAPLLVDPVYGRAASVRAADLGRSGQAACGRLTLHAARIEFPDPDTGATISVEAPLAADLAEMIAALDGHCPA